MKRPVVYSGYLFILLLTTVFLTTAAAHEKEQILEIYLEDEVVYRNDTLTVGDVISSSTSRKYDQLKLDRTLPVHKDRMVIMPLRTVRNEIEEAYHGPIILVGTRITIIPGSLALQDSHTAFYRLFARELEGIFVDENTLISVEFISRPERIPDNVHQIGFRIQKQNAGNPLPVGLCSVHWNNRGEGYAPEGIFDVIIHAYTRVIVPKHRIKSGELITFDNTDSIEADLSEYPSELLTDEDFFPLKAITDLEYGKPVMKKWVTKNIIVRAGERIRITFQRKNLVVSMTGRALSSGSFDDTVQVRPEGSRKSFQGNVSGDREVRIEFR